LWRVLGRWRAPAATGVLLGGSTLHSLLSAPPSQLSTSMTTTASRRTTEALKAVLDAVDVDGAAETVEVNVLWC
jgi:hypothetical protein